ncbi:MAG: Na+/H+ antiporter [Chloroflexota bacterium]|jgi:CPA1 family monovalent cation:H+ antiporter
MDFLAHLTLLAQEESQLVQTELAFVLLLSLSALVAIISRRIRLPYTVALVLVGLGLSFFPSPISIDLSSELILALLVPPLIFEATLNLPWQQLRRNLAPILLLAIVGTTAGTFIVASIITFAGNTLVPELDIAFAATFAFGALISATDPVAVISLFRELGVGKRLAILVEGESLFNDGVAIVIFNLALAAGAVAVTGEGEALGPVAVIGEFLRVAVGGLVIGGLLGFLVSMVILKNVDDALIETATTVALAFGAFIVAEELHVSGVLSVVAAGIFVGNIGTQNTSPTTKITLDSFWEFAAFVVNSMVFLLIGLEADWRQLQPNLGLIVVAILAVLFSRIIVVYGLTWLHGLLNRTGRIPPEYRHVMYWGGLRGAISLALALGLTGSIFDDVVVAELQLMTFGVVLFTLLVQGTTIAPLLTRLGLTATPDQKYKQYRRQAQLYALRAGQRELDRLFREGILTQQAHQAMSSVYDRDFTRLNSELRDLLYDYPELEQAMILQARRDLLQAERTALSDAARRGLIPEDVYHELILETDNRLAAVRRIVETTSESQERD